jgi:YidC/Oxa1 family membrane protein insertase
MNPFSLLRTEIVRRPMYNSLVLFLFLFNGNLWLAIIALTLVIRFMMLGSSKATSTMQKSMTDLQPKMQEIQEKYKDQPEKQSEEMMKLFKTQWAWPFKGCLTMLLQIPVFLGLFYTIQEFASGTINTEVYSFLSGINITLDQVNPMFLGIDLLVSNNILLALLAAIAMFLQMSLMQWVQPKPAVPAALTWWQAAPDMGSMMKYMNYVFMIMMGWFVYSVPAAVGLYIFTTTIFGVGQQYFQYQDLVNFKLKQLLRLVY